MKTKATKTKVSSSWALPGDPISLEEFKAGIKEAEQGPFITLEELKNSIEEWKKKPSL